MDEVGFAETGATIKKEWVVAITRGIDNTLSGGEGKVVVGADDEIIKSVFLVEASFMVTGIIYSSLLLYSGELFLDREVPCGDFAGANFGFNFGLDFEIDGFDIYIIVLKGGGDEVEVAVAELFDVEGILDTDDDMTIVVRDDGCTLKPS